MLTCFEHNLSFRQQLHVDDDKKLAGLLNFETEKVKKYDVFVYELCDGNISEAKVTSDGSLRWTSVQKRKFTLSQSVDICKQLIQGLQQLEESNKCHNDLKPENILYKASRKRLSNGEQKISIKIGDFGTAGRSGGPPRWTWP